MGALRRRVLGEQSLRSGSPEHDPGGSAKEELRNEFKRVLLSLEGAVMEATGAPDTLRDAYRKDKGGFTFNPETGRAEMADFLAVLTNKVQLVTFPHVITSSYMTGGAVVLGVALWLWMKHDGTADAPMYRSAVKVGSIFTVIASLLVIVTGDIQGKIMTEVQPMKMAAAEALYTSEDNAGFSIFTIGSLDGSKEVFSIKVPGLLSFLATGDFGAKVEGIKELEAKAKELPAKVDAQYGPEVAKLATADSYTPNIPMSYWSFRLMMGLGFLSTLFGIMAWMAARKEKAPSGGLWRQIAIWTPLLPVIAISFGWIFTEIGRQPWIVNGLMTTDGQGHQRRVRHRQRPHDHRDWCLPERGRR